MKKLFFAFSSMMLALISASLLVACSDDDDDESQTSLDDIVGLYSGDMDCDVTVMGRVINIDYNEVKAEVSKNADGQTLCIKIKDFAYAGDNYGDIVIDNVVVDKYNDDGSVTLAGTNVCPLTKNEKAYDATVAMLGSFTRLQNSLQLDIDMSLPVSEKMTILFKIDYQSLTRN
ncbi:MAG: calycin-like domain-containing protein [Bacteroidales bacterium]|nr:calycin-like domain-containing protein [Bacteroidales bacterium]